MCGTTKEAPLRALVLDINSFTYIYTQICCALNSQLFARQYENRVTFQKNSAFYNFLAKNVPHTTWLMNTVTYSTL